MPAYNYRNGRLMGSSHEYRESLARTGYETVQVDSTVTTWGIEGEPEAIILEAHDSEQWSHDHVYDQALAGYNEPISLVGLSGVHLGQS